MKNSTIRQSSFVYCFSYILTESNLTEDVREFLQDKIIDWDADNPKWWKGTLFQGVSCRLCVAFWLARLVVTMDGGWKNQEGLKWLSGGVWGQTALVWVLALLLDVVAKTDAK